MNAHDLSRGAPGITSISTISKPGAIAILVMLGVSFGGTMVLWSVATRQSNLYSSGFSISLRTLPTFDGYSYQMFEIVPDSVHNASAGSVPFVLYIHGLGSSKELELPRALSIAANGYVVFVPDTRGQNSHTGPFSFGVDDVTDLRDLITWVQGSTHLPIVNKTSVGVFGHSMGALLTLLLAAQDSRVNCTVEASGPVNMTRVLQAEWFRISLIGSPVDINDPYEVARRTPLTYCTPTNPRNLLIAHGTQDTSVPFEHSQDLNASVNPTGTRSDFSYLIYNSGHSLDDPYPGNASRTCFEDLMARSVLWYNKYLKNDTSVPYDAVEVVQRDDIARSMNQTYDAMYIALLITIIFSFFTLVLGIGLIWEKTGNRLSRGTKKMEPATQVVSSALILPTRKAVARQLVYIGIYIVSFAITGIIFVSSPVSLILKTIIFPILPVIPVALIKIKGERDASYYRELGLTGKQTVISVCAAFIAFGMYIGLYDLLTTRVYSRIQVIQYVLQGTTGMALPVLFWYILPGIVALLLVDTTYFQVIYTQLTAAVRPRKIKIVLNQWLVKALLLALIVGVIHTCGTLLFNAPLPDYDLRTIGSLQFMFKELLAILSIGVIAGFVFVALLVTRFTKNLPGAAVVVGLILSLVYVTAVPRIF
nr:alpha/beta fold hydrolase [Candidatus Sigynarchaeota archaeon]